MLTPTGEARRREIGKLRIRLFKTAARLVRTGRWAIVRLAERRPAGSRTGQAAVPVSVLR